MFSQGHISEEIPQDITAVQYLGFAPMNPLESAANFLNPKYWIASYQGNRYGLEKIAGAGEATMY